VHQYNTSPKNKIAELIYSDLRKNYSTDYSYTRELMNLLFEQKIIKEVLFEIQDSHVTCTINFDPKYLEFPKYFMQDAASYQSRASGKTEQEAFFSALSKITLFAKLSPKGNSYLSL
jgi:hypothetical protein